MYLREIAKSIRNEDRIILGSVLPEDLRIADLTAEQLHACGETVFTVDAHGAVTGKTQKELLEYIRKQQTREIVFKLLNCLEDGVIAVDAAGRIYYANTAYTSLLGVPLRRIIGRFIQDVEPESLLCRALLEQRPQSSDRQLVPSVHKYVSLRAFPLWENGDFIGAVSIFQDVTELYNLDKEVQKMANIADEYFQQLKTISTVQAMDILTQDRRYLTILDQATVVARTDVPVLIRGENGVGKEVLAKYIHQCSERKDEPLITVNCAAIPAELLESELFGYEEGAFTGAVKGGRKGKFELADRGTIFLDEIGDMPITMQSKLLRVIQYGEIEKLGRQKNTRVDVRILAATNQPLEQLIAEKRFRKDLFFRLNIFTLQIPPLRERPDDILLLADHFLKQFNQKYDKHLRLTQQVYQQLQSHSWPGNIRELQGYIERIVILENAGLAQNPPLGWSAPAAVPVPLPGGDLKSSLQAYEKQLLQQALEASGGNKTLAMHMLGVSRRTFYRKCAEYHIPASPPDK